VESGATEDEEGRSDAAAEAARRAVADGVRDTVPMLARAACKPHHRLCEGECRIGELNSVPRQPACRFRASAEPDCQCESDPGFGMDWAMRRMNCSSSSAVAGNAHAFEGG